MQIAKILIYFLGKEMEQDSKSFTIQDHVDSIKEITPIARA